MVRNGRASLVVCFHAPPLLINLGIKVQQRFIAAMTYTTGGAGYLYLALRLDYAGEVFRIYLRSEEKTSGRMNTAAGSIIVMC